MASLSERPTLGIGPDLLALVGKGDRRAFGRLYDQSCSVLYTLCLRMLGNREEAADVLQEVYTEVWCKVARYDAQRGSPMAWLVTLTRSRAIDRLRARKSRGHAVTDSINETTATELQDRRPTPFEQQADDELRALIAKALADLPEAQRRAVEMAYYDGLSHREIAERLQEPLGTIKSRIKLGMSKLKASLHSYWE
jgi:RNA polymerase sigma-70 factor (ECF subfamily)